MSLTPKDGDYTAYLKDLQSTESEALQEAMQKEKEALEASLSRALESSSLDSDEDSAPCQTAAGRSSHKLQPQSSCQDNFLSAKQKRRMKIPPPNYVPVSAQEHREQPSASPSWADPKKEAQKKAQPVLPPAIGIFIFACGSIGIFGIFKVSRMADAPSYAVPLLGLILAAILAGITAVIGRRLRKKAKRRQQRLEAEAKKNSF